MSDSKEIEFNRDALVDKTNTLLDEVERLRDEWERSREMIESAKQMRITAQGYIDSMEATQKALSNCVCVASATMVPNDLIH